MRPPTIPDHILLRAIGRGAYGEVWLARNVMGTLRAVKIIWREQFESDRPFEREFAGIQRYEPVSRSSGGLVHVLHVGRNDTEGCFYYVMELADAAQAAQPAQLAHPHLVKAPLETSDASGYQPRTLRSELKRRRCLSTVECVRLGLEVASGLEQLHRHRLIHRDVKPGNIIYVNGRAKLADIGLVTNEGEGRTFVGTEGYIPPEGPGTPSADLYALGVVIYEASTGFSPDRCPDIPADWLAPSAGDEALELHEIVLKACEGQRERRYPSVAAMQADLALLQSGQSLRRVRALERRYARLKTVGVVGTALLAAAVIAAVFANYRARLAAESRSREASLRLQAQQSLSRAEAAEREARHQLYNALLEQARATVRSGELGQRERALEAIRRAAAISNTAELRGAAMAALALPDLRLERDLPNTDWSTLIQLDPAFERIALCRRDGPVEIRAVSNGRLLFELPASSKLSAFLGWWSADGRFLAVKRDRIGSGARADLEVWNVKERRRVLLLHDVEYGVASFHPRWPRMLAGRREGSVAIWDLESAQEVARFEAADPPMLLRFSPDGERYAAGYSREADWAVSVHQAANGALLMEHPLTNFLAGLDWHPSGRWIATADHGGSVQLIDARTGEAKVLGRHKVQAVSAAFTSDGAYLLSAGWEREFICWDLHRLERAFTIGLNSWSAQLRADGGACAITSDTGVQLHAFERPLGRREFKENLGPRLQHAAFSADGRWLAASAGERLGVWDLSVAGPGATAAEGADARLFFSNAGELFASTDNESLHWHLTPAINSKAPPKLERIALANPPGLTSLCLVSNQLFVTAEQGTRALPVERSGSGESGWVRTSNGLSGVSSDARWLGIYQPYSRLLHIYVLPGLQERATLTNHASISRFEFSPLADEVAVSTAKSVEFWSTATWRRTRELTEFRTLLYSQDGLSYWIMKDYRRAGLYDAHTLAPILPLPDGTLPLALSPNGRFLAVSVDARHLQVWDLNEAQERLRELGLDWKPIK
jgi:WD40 repeat protein